MAALLPKPRPSRARLEALVWKFSHKDYRAAIASGPLRGKRSVLVLESGVTTLSPIARLSTEKLWSLLPQKVREEYS